MELALACRCGRFRATVLGAGARGTRIVCHCRDCRAGARVAGSGAEVVDLLQTTPDRFRIDAGAEHLAAFLLTEGGLLRWYAACCGTPVANTLRRGGFPLVSVQVGELAPREALDRVLGPVAVEAFRPAGSGPRHRGLAPMIAGLAGRTLAAYALRRDRLAPLFRPDGTPLAVPRVLTEEERRAAYAAP